MSIAGGRMTCRGLAVLSFTQCGAGSARFSSPADEEPGNYLDINPTIYVKHTQTAARIIFATIESHAPDFLTPATAEHTN